MPNGTPGAMDEGEGGGALSGLVIVELGEGVAPAFCGKWLAAFGATVIKVEGPSGDWTRLYHPLPGRVPAAGAGPLFTYLNTGKQHLILDLEAAAGRERLRQVISGAQILIHTLSPAERTRLLGDATLESEAARGLVEVALSAFGSDGPYKDFAATSIVLLALGGYQFLSGEPGRAPLALPGFQPEYLTALYGVVGALAGLAGRDSTASGASIEISSLEVMASLHQFTISQYLYQGTIRSRHGSRWENLYPNTLLPCRDGAIGIAISTQDQWERLCLMMERPHLLEDPRFLTPMTCSRYADELEPILIEWLSHQRTEDFFRRAQEEWRLPVAPLYGLDAVLTNPQYQERGFWVRPEGKDGAIQPGLAPAFSETPWRIRPAPQLEEHRPAVEEPVVRPAQPPARFQTATQTQQRPRASSQSNGAMLLAGVRVLDFTRVWSGPLCTRILADLGAEVIKIEAPAASLQAKRLSPARGNSGPALRPAMPIPAMKLNRNKKSIVVDLQQPAGRDLVRRLVAQSDVLVENFSARVMPNFGLTYEDLKPINARLVMLSMPGFGSAGPFREYLAYGPAIEPMTGFTCLLGYPGERPLTSAIAYPDAVAGMTAAAALLTALAYQRRTGRGQFIDLSQLEATTTLLGEYLLAFQQTGELPPRLGNGHAIWAPHGAYRCSGEDEWVSLAVRSDTDWRHFCTAAGFSSLLDNPDYETAAQRLQRHEQLDAAISTWTANKTKFEVMETLQAAGVPAGAVLNARELLENPQLAFRGFFVDAQDPQGQSFRMPGTPILVDGKRRSTWHAAPLPGEDNATILRSVLGMDDTEIGELEERGVLGARV